MVIASLCLHNLCLIHADEFDMNWVRSVEEELKKTSLQNFDDFREVDLFDVLESDNSEIENIQRKVVQIEFNDIDTSEMDMIFELEENVAEPRENRDERTNFLY